MVLVVTRENNENILIVNSYLSQQTIANILSELKRSLDGRGLFYFTHYSIQIAFLSY